MFYNQRPDRAACFFVGFSKSTGKVANQKTPRKQRANSWTLIVLGWTTIYEPIRLKCDSWRRSDLWKTTAGSVNDGEKDRRRVYRSFKAEPNAAQKTEASRRLMKLFPSCIKQQLRPFQGFVLTIKPPADSHKNVKISARMTACKVKDTENCFCCRWRPKCCEQHETSWHKTKTQSATATVNH